MSKGWPSLAGGRAAVAKAVAKLRVCAWGGPAWGSLAGGRAAVAKAVAKLRVGAWAARERSVAASRRDASRTVTGELAAVREAASVSAVTERKLGGPTTPDFTPVSRPSIAE
ncbi:hypothetical protein [Actinoplanes sp. NPDC049681]|uniref:hypothetical protein n=1 Tax=Actinoplanes sp. NPDC049681 TaxID=3363905 RepID=UPI0037A2CB33